MNSRCVFVSTPIGPSTMDFGAVSPAPDASSQAETSDLSDRSRAVRSPRLFRDP
jgi:hypothetical protein